jgi:hypothetical protein
VPGACVSCRDAALWEGATGTPPPQLSLGGRAIARCPTATATATATGSVSRLFIAASRSAFGFARNMRADRNRASDAMAGFAVPGAGGRRHSIALTHSVLLHEPTRPAPDQACLRRVDSRPPCGDSERTRTYPARNAAGAAPQHRGKTPAAPPAGQEKPEGAARLPHRGPHLRASAPQCSDHRPATARTGTAVPE